MIRLIHNKDGSVDLHVDTQTVGFLASAITNARPCGSSCSPDGKLRVHVHGKAATPRPPHQPIEAT